MEDGQDIWMRLEVKGRKSCFKWSLDGDTYKEIGPCFLITKFSDEYSEFGEFTGTFEESPVATVCFISTQLILISLNMWQMRADVK